MFLMVFKNIMDDLNIKYYLYTYGINKITDDYFFIGARHRLTTSTEDGEIKGSFTLYGYSKIGLKILEQKRDLLYNMFRTSKRFYDNGIGLAINFDGSLNVDTNKQDFKMIEISFSYNEWRV